RNQCWKMDGALVGTRTPNLLIRSQTLYPIELRVRSPVGGRRESRNRARVSRISPKFVAQGAENSTLLEPRMVPFLQRDDPVEEFLIVRKAQAFRGIRP